MKKLILLSSVLICASAYSQKTTIKENVVYKIDCNVYSKDPFEKKEVNTVKVLEIKQGYVQYQIIKAWCCIGDKFSQRLDVFEDQVISYKRKYK